MFEMIPKYLISTAALAVLHVSAQNHTVPFNIVGYFPYDGDSWYPVSCGDSTVTFTTSNEYGKCCSDVNYNCNFITACEGTSWSRFDASGTCGTGSSCVSMTVYESDSSGQSFLYPWCNRGAMTMSSIFRQTARATTTDGPLGTTATPGSKITSTITAEITAPNSGSTATTTNTSAHSGNSDSGGDSKAWIAGAVIGPVAGVAFLAGLGYWIFRRRLGRRNSQPAEIQSTPVQPMYTPTYEKPPDSSPRAELPS